MNGVSKVFAMKDAAFYIAFGEDRDLFGDVEFFERADEIEITVAMRFGDAFEFAFDEGRAEYAIRPRSCSRGPRGLRPSVALSLRLLFGRNA